MAIMKVLYYPDPRLAQKCKPVTKFDEKLEAKTKRMFETMYAYEGVGLSASQVGIMKRFAVIDVSPTKDKPLVIVNPEIISHDGIVNCSEGCLSIPDYHETVKRYKTIKVKAQDIHGKEFEIEAEDLLARCIQHEMDHMDGILFVNRGSALKRQMFRRWMSKHTFEEVNTDETEDTEVEE